MLRTALLLAVCLPLVSSANAADWTQWRGPGHNNIAAAGQTVPTEWSSTKNVAWRTKVPGRGHSTPIVVGDLIVLTSADEQSQTQAIIGFDRSTGQQRWLTPISRGGFPKIHQKNTHASATAAAADGRFYATFCHHKKIEAVAVDGDGKILWQQDVGPFSPKAYEYGYGASPTIFGNTLIVTAECDTSAWMKALDLKTGKVVWEQKRPQVLNWASPIVARVQGQEQLLLSGGYMIAGYDPASGRQHWQGKCLTMATCGTCVWSDGLVIASGGFPDPGTAAVRADGSGEIVWTNRIKCYEQSLLAHDGYIYAHTDRGVAYCWDAATGDEMWKGRLAGPVSASPLLVGDHIHASDERGTTWVYRASPQKFEPVAKNKLGTESFASAVVVDNVMYRRVAEGRRGSRQEYLYAISQ